MTPTLPTPEETNAILAVPDHEDVLAQLTEEEKPLATKLIYLLAPKLQADAETKATAKHAAQMSEELAHLVEVSRKTIAEEKEAFIKSQTPLTPEELEKLINQEYFESTIVLGREKIEYVIRELPVRVEQKFIKALKKTLTAGIKELGSLSWSTEQSNLEKFQQLLDMVPGALETLAECTALCLNPFGESKVDTDWVLDNLPSAKMLAVLKLQGEANRWRDFFSLVSQAIPSQMTA